MHWQGYRATYNSPDGSTETRYFYGQRKDGAPGAKAGTDIAAIEDFASEPSMDSQLDSSLWWSSWLTGSAEPRGRFAGIPSTLNSADLAYSTSSGNHELVARFFQNGIPNSDNPSTRRFTFANQDHVDIEAHQPELDRSDDNKFAIAGTVAAGFFVPPVAAGVLSGVAAGSVLPKDAAWQPYTASFYHKDGTLRGTLYVYGWARSGSVNNPPNFGGNTDKNQWPFFADMPNQVTWWPWKESDTAAYLPGMPMPARIFPEEL